VTPFWLGLLIVLAGAFFQGTWALPQKFVRGWAWEKMWLFYSIAATVVFPWLLLTLVVPDVAGVYSGVDGWTLARTALFGAGWGIGNVLFGLGVASLGMALAFAIIISLTAALGMLIPMAILTPEQFTPQRGGLLIAGLLLVIVGVALCSKAGALKDPSAATGQRSFKRGLLICIASGVTSPMFNFGYAFGAPIQARAAELGAAPDRASIAVLAVITTAGFVVNAAYCIYLLAKNRTWSEGAPSDLVRNLACIAGMGFMWILGFFLFGIGSTRMSDLGKSVGWAILMTMMVLVANVWGLVTGEWKNADKRAFRFLGVGLALMVAALVVISLASA